MNFEKWKEENGLTRIGNYEINIDFEHIGETINRYKKYKLNLTPDFQRGHVWNQEQQIAFVTFLLRGGKTTPIYFNHPGWMNDFKGDFVIVDGLQRLTALLKFHSNKIPCETGHFYEDFENIRLLDIDVRFNINNLKTRREVLKWYLEINSGGTPHSFEEIERVKKLLDKEE